MALLPKTTQEWTKEQKLSLRFFAGLALKYNVKAGGTNHILDLMKLPIFKARNPIFFGIHSVTVASSSSTITSVVANCDLDLGRWPGSVRYHDERGMMVDDLAVMIEERLACFTGNGKNKDPSIIIVYRSGVSESQYQRVLDQEYPKIASARDAAYSGGDKPKITMVIVTDRHQGRFDPEGNQRSEAHCIAQQEREDPKLPTPSSVVRPGTVVKRETAVSDRWDFFLQSHHAASGTVCLCNHMFVIAY